MDKSVTIARSKTRGFVITVGTVPGYSWGNERQGGGIRFSHEHVVLAHHNWQLERQTIQGVEITPCTISYGYRDDQGQVNCAEEPGFTLAGTINPLYDMDLSDADAYARIYDLASWMRATLMQTRVYFVFNDINVIIEGADTAPEIDDPDDTGER